MRDQKRAATLSSITQRISKEEKSRLRREYKRRIETEEAFDKAHADVLLKSRRPQLSRIASIALVALIGLALLILWANMSNGSQSSRHTTTSNSTSVGSPSPLQVFNYCEDMWNAAVALGRPISDDWDNPVFDSAAKHFGISTDRVRDLYFKEANRRAGID